MESLRVPRPATYNPPVWMTKTAYLQRIQEAVGDGYRYHVCGTVQPSAAIGLARKFAELYGVHHDKNERYRRKAAGLGNARLFLHLDQDSNIAFALLVTPGVHSAHQLERLADATKVPVRYREFELVMLTLKHRAKPGLTWRLDSEAISAWRTRLHLHTAHYNKAELFRDWFSLYRIPGFAGVRKQVGELVGYWRREWHKLRGADPCPMCFPHEEQKFRSIPGVSRAKDGTFLPDRGFPTTRQLPTLFYVRKHKAPSQTLRALVKSLAGAANPQDIPSAAEAPDARRQV